MTAVIRSTSSASGKGPFEVPAPDGVTSGMTLLAFLGADEGPLSISGGWQRIGRLAGSQGVLLVDVWWRRTTAGEPDAYTVSQESVSDGVAALMAIVGASDSQPVVTPGQFSGDTIFAVTLGGTPLSPSGLDIRWAAGIPDPAASLEWTSTGYTEVERPQSNVSTGGTLVWKPIVSTTTLGFGFHTASSNLLFYGGMTVLVDAAPIEVPEPPTYPSFTPGRGSSRYRFVFRRLLDRTYLGDLDLENVTFDTRIGQAGSLQATVPIPSRRVGDLVATIIPRDETELGIGPGVISCEIYRSGVCWGEYWITGAQLRRNRRDTPSIQLRGSTLEAYLAHVELQDGLSFAHQDQIGIARDLLSHLMTRPHANLGLVLQPGLSGVLRDRTYEADQSTYGARLQELGEVENGFEHNIRMELVGGALQRHWVWGYPTLGQQTPALHTFVDSVGGGDILDWQEDIDALRGGTRWRARGGTSTNDASSSGAPLISSVHEAAAHLAAGWPRLDRTINKSTVVLQQTLEDWAAYWAATAPGALRVDSLTVALGAEPTFTPASLGDAARIYLSNEWHTGIWRTRRIIGMAITPTSKEDGIEEAQLILEGREVSE